MMALQVMNPQQVIDQQSKDRNMEDLIIESFKKNVRTYLTKTQEMRNDIYSLLKDGIK